MSHGDPSHPQEYVHAGDPHAAPHGAPAAPLFPKEEVATLRAADVLAAGWIVGLMGGIFSVGVLLYLIVFFSVLEAPQWWWPVP